MLPLTHNCMLAYWRTMAAGYFRDRHRSVLARDNARAVFVKLREVKEKSSMPAAPAAVPEAPMPTPRTPAAPDGPRMIECPAGLTTVQNARAIYIRSPRTVDR